MTSGKCDLFCEQCYTDQIPHQGAWLIYESAIHEAYAYGAKIVYIAGEGEPFLDDYIGNIIRLAAKLGMKILMFSNGLQFCHETPGYRSIRAKIIEREGEVDAQTLVRWLAEMPIHLYLKMHSANRTTNSRLCGLTGRKLDYTYEQIGWNGQQIDVPTPLLRLPEWGFPIERLGFDMMVVHENAGELLNVIGPWSQSAGLALYAEPFIPSGRILGNPAPTTEQLTTLRQAGVSCSTRLYVQSLEALLDKYAPRD